MTTRPKLQFDEFEVPYTCIMKFTEPKIYNGQYGLSYMWTVEHNSMEKVFYASQGLNAMLTNMDLTRDQMVTIVKHTNGLDGKEQRSWFSVDGLTIDELNKGKTNQDTHHNLDIKSDADEEAMTEASFDTITKAFDTQASLARIEKKVDSIMEAVDAKDVVLGAKKEEETDVPF